ncbi:MAG: thermonuclease family protein [Phycisphaerales bacterium]|jgi:endonuclease YncB( thermonuclease family)|nr:thermonuclease family protein [Phycisphaerales bacterium]
MAGLLLLIVTAVVMDHLGVFGDHEDDLSRYDHKQGEVHRVIDGDSAVVSVNSQEVLIHLMGVDAPDMKFTDQQVEEYWSTQARNYLLERLTNKTITLKLDPQQTRDRFGRLLVYAYLSDTDNINLGMVRDGYAYADRREKHLMEAQFESAEAEARQRRRGLWMDITVQLMPTWRQHWLEERKQGSTEP